jgi:hypothetical protein
VSHPERHLDPDELADVLAGVASADAEEHVAGCDPCEADLAQLEAASTQVTADLAALPALSLPGDIAARLQAALADADSAEDDRLDLATEPTPGSATVTPFPAAGGNPQAARWLAAAAAIVVLLAGGIYGFTQLRGGDDSSSTSAGNAAGADKAAPELALARNSSGTDYTDRASLSAALPDLLAGRRQAADTAMVQAPAPAASGPQRGANTLAVPAADPLAPLREDKGLAECLVALLPPDDPSVQPLAIDYASYQGRPAMVVVIPSSIANKLDVFVVGPTCSRANDSVLFYTSVDKP